MLTCSPQHKHNYSLLSIACTNATLGTQTQTQTQTQTHTISPTAAMLVGEDDDESSVQHRISQFSRVSYHQIVENVAQVTFYLQTIQHNHIMSPTSFGCSYTINAALSRLDELDKHQERALRVIERSANQWQKSVTGLEDQVSRLRRLLIDKQTHLDILQLQHQKVDWHPHLRVPQY